MALIPKINFKKTGGLVAGAVATNLVKNKFLASQNQYIQNGGPFVLGLFLSGQKDSFLSGIGDGMIATGGAALLSSFVPGISEDVMMNEDVLMQGDNYENYASDSQDTTPAFAGEMNY